MESKVCCEVFSCKVETLVQDICGLFRYGDMRISKSITIHRSRPRPRGGRENIKVRIVGDNSFGWTQAVQVWGAEVEEVIDKAQDNH